jgi:hypothetical protein
MFLCAFFCEMNLKTYQLSCLAFCFTFYVWEKGIVARKYCKYINTLSRYVLELRADPRFKAEKQSAESKKKKLYGDRKDSTAKIVDGKRYEERRISILLYAHTETRRNETMRNFFKFLLASFFRLVLAIFFHYHRMSPFNDIPLWPLRFGSAPEGGMMTYRRASALDKLIDGVCSMICGWVRECFSLSPLRFSRISGFFVAFPHVQLVHMR